MITIFNNGRQYGKKPETADMLIELLFHYSTD